LHPPPPPALYPLSLHDALPICLHRGGSPRRAERSTRLTRPTPSSTRAPRAPATRASSSSRTWRAFGVSAPGATACARRSTSTKRSEEHTSELQSRFDLVCRLLL